MARFSELLLVIFTCHVVAGNNADVGSQGQEFVFAIPRPDWGCSPRIILTTSVLETVNVNITIWAINIRKQATLTYANSVTVSVISTACLTSGSGIKQQTVVVESTSPISVHVFNTDSSGGEGFLALPTARLGKTYYVTAFLPTGSRPAFAAVSATDVQTTVEVTPKGGDSYTVDLQKHETYVLETNNDPTGTRLSANKPVSVIAGLVCGFIPEGSPRCSSILEQLPSLNQLGHYFIVGPFMGRSFGYVCRIVGVNETLTNVNVSNSNSAIQLNAGDKYDIDIDDDTILEISSDRPVLVMQYKKYRDQENEEDDYESMVVVPAVEFFSRNVKFPVYPMSPPPSWASYTPRYHVHVVVKCEYASSLTFDGAPMTGEIFRSDSGNMCILRKQVTTGMHGIEHMNATFYIIVYGSSYIYPAAFNLNKEFTEDGAIFARIGDTVILPCNETMPTPAPSRTYSPYLLEWVRTDLSYLILRNSSSTPPYIDDRYTGRVSIVDGLALKIDEVRIDDDGWYKCQIINLNDLNGRSLPLDNVNSSHLVVIDQSTTTPTSSLTKLMPTTQIPACAGGTADVGWDLVTRTTSASVNYLFIFPLKVIPWDGVVTEWSVKAKEAWPLFVTVFRPVTSDGTFKIIGINQIDSVIARQVTTYTVPSSERIQVKQNDVIGFISLYPSTAVYSDNAADNLYYYARYTGSSTVGLVGATFESSGSSSRRFSIQAKVMNQCDGPDSSQERSADIGSQGQEFVFSIPRPDPDCNPRIILTTSATETVRVDITISAINFWRQAAVSSADSVIVTVPSSACIASGSGIKGGTVKVKSTRPISVHVFNTDESGGDGFLALPTAQLGKTYYITAFTPTAGRSSFAAISATDAQTTVEVTPKGGDSYTVTLQPYETYQLEANSDPTGTRLSANKPIAVVAGSVCAAIPVGGDPGGGPACDSLLEQLPAVHQLGHNFVLGPYMGHRAGYICRIVGVNETLTNVEVSSRSSIIQLNAGDFYDIDIEFVTDPQIIEISSDKPVLVMQYMKFSVNDRGDASMNLVPAVDFFSGNVNFPVFKVTDSDTEYGVQVGVECKYAYSLIFDGAPMTVYDEALTVYQLRLPTTGWELLRSDSENMCVLRNEVTTGVHVMEHAEATFYIVVCGYSYKSSYAYPAAFNLNKAPLLVSTATPNSYTECYTEAKGQDYRGHTSSTERGEVCQKWTSQTPHDHSYTPENWPGTGIGDHNYCRNPGGDPKAWCYTIDPGTRWEYCDIGQPSTSCDYQCETITTPSYGRRRFQNSDFVFLDSANVDGRDYFTIGIQGSVDAYIILSPSRNPSNDNIGDTGIPKLVIGGWNNEYSGVICNSNQDANADFATRYYTPYVISSSEMRYFTISWTNDQIQVARIGSSSSLFTHQLDCPVNVRYIGACTGWSTGVEWTTCISGTSTESTTPSATIKPKTTPSTTQPATTLETIAGPIGHGACKICKAIDLVCNETTMTAVFKTSVHQIKRPSDVHLWDSSCVASEYGENKAILTTNYKMCNTTTQESRGYMVYKNALILGPDNPHSTILPPQVTIECRVKSQQGAVTSGNLYFNLEIYQDATYRAPYQPEDYPIGVKVGDEVYLAGSVTTVPEQHLFLESCWATPTTDPYHESSHSLITNGCHSDLSLTRYNFADPNVGLFSFKPFPFRNNWLVFIHCQMLVCDVSTPDSRCKQGCLMDSSTGNEQHLSRSNEDRRTVTVGPLVVRGKWCAHREC